MDRSQLRVIIGGADPSQKKEKKVFAGAYATDSRLMGVLVVYLKWIVMPDDQGEAVPGYLHQFFYIETQEIGLESYKSVRGDDSMAMLEAEQTMLGGLGSTKVDISEREAVLILQRYASVNKKHDEPLPDGEDEYNFLLSRAIDADELEFDLLFARICTPLTSDNEVINYFLMRYFAGDEDAVRHLTDFELPPELQASHYDDTLCLNKIRQHTPDDEDRQKSYVSESLIEAGSEHRIIVSESTVNDGKVSSFGIISDFQISNAETAMKLERPEFITVFDVFLDPDTVTEYLDDHYPATMKRDTEAGRLYLRFNENNDHVKGSLYRLNDDVNGMFYVTDEAQLILAAYSLVQIHRLEREAQTWPFGRQLLPIAKYEFKEDIFYDFLSADSGDFVQYVEYLCDIDPDDDK
jgi:hypothetical protein